MGTKLAVAYLATPLSGGSCSIELWVNDDGSFSITSGSAGVLTYSSISRVDFYARPNPESDPQLLAVVPCIPAKSSIGLTSSPAGISFSLAIRDLLGGANVSFSSTIRWNSGSNADLYFSVGLTVGIGIGPNAWVGPVKPFDQDNIWARYFDNLLQLRLVNPSPTINANAAPSSFETISLNTFASQHVSFQTRFVNTGNSSPLPVFCPYRGYTIPTQPAGPCGWSAALFNGPFDLAISPNGAQNSDYHVAQFPSIAWLKTVAGPLPESTVWHFETGEFHQEEIEKFWNQRIRQPYIGGLRLVNATQPLSLLPSIAWPPATAGTDTSWRIVRTASIASDATTLTLLSERLLPGGYLLALSGAAAGPVSVSGQFSAFRTHDKTALQFTAKLQSWTDFDVETTGETQVQTVKPKNAVHRMNFTLDPGRALSATRPSRITRSQLRQCSPERGGDHTVV